MKIRVHKGGLIESLCGGIQTWKLLRFKLFINFRSCFSFIIAQKEKFIEWVGVTLSYPYLGSFLINISKILLVIKY